MNCEYFGEIMTSLVDIVNCDYFGELMTSVVDWI